MNKESVLIGFQFFFIIFVSLFVGVMAGRTLPKHVILSVAVLIFSLLVFHKTEYGIYLLILSLIFSPELQLGAAGGRAVVLRLDDYLIIILFIIWLIKSALLKDMFIFQRTPLNQLIFIITFLYIISTCRGYIMGLNSNLIRPFFYILKYIEYFMIYFMVYNSFKDPGEVKRIIFFLIVTIFFLLCYLYYQKFFGSFQGNRRISAPFEGGTAEPNTLGGFLVFMMSICMGMTIHSVKKIPRWFFFIFFLGMLPPLAWTQSRASYTAFVFSLLFFVLLAKKKNFVVLFCMASLIIVPFILPEVVKERVEYTFRGRVKFKKIRKLNKVEIKLDPSSVARLNSWKKISHWTSTSILNSLLGYGVTTVGLVDAYYVLVIGELGLIGLILQLILFSQIFLMVRQFYHELDYDETLQGLLIGYIVGFIALLFHAIVANTFIIVRIAGPFWLMTGVIFKIMHLQHENVTNKELKYAA